MDAPNPRFSNPELPLSGRCRLIGELARQFEPLGDDPQTCRPTICKFVRRSMRFSFAGRQGPTLCAAPQQGEPANARARTFKDVGTDEHFVSSAG
jgi:hypothetical protein